MLAKIIELEKIPENIQSYLHTDHRQTRLGYNFAWAKTYLKPVGAMENSTRGVWSLTEAGEQMNDQDCAKVRRQDAERKRAKDEQFPENAPPISEPSPEKSWKDTLIGVLRQMPPDAFERLAQRILREAGFIKVEITGRSGDGGIDGLGVLRVNFSPSRFCFSASAIRAPLARVRFGISVVRWSAGAIKGS